MEKISRYMDHAVLKPEMTREEAISEIKLGVEYDVATVCVRPCDIDIAKEICKGTNTRVITVLAFPHGDTLSEVKAAEAKIYIEKGADEVDMVVNYGFVRSGLWDLVKKDILAVTQVAKPYGTPVKVIVEANTLTVDEIKKTTEIAIEAGADFVKTSTGFNGPGATVEAVQAMLDASKGRIKVKPSGGIRGYEAAKHFIEMGANRLGVGSASIPAICKGEELGGQGY